MNKITIDEIHLVPQWVYQEILEPITADRRGQIMVCGQFRGMNHWTYTDLYARGLKNEKGYASFCYPTSSGMAFQDDTGRELLNRLERELPRAVWDQEYMCIPTANAAAVFRADDIKTITRGLHRHSGAAGYNYIVSCDLGRVVDPSAIVVLENETRTVVYSEIVPIGTRHEVTAKRYAETCRRFNDAVGVIDSTGGAGGGRHDIDAFVKYYKSAWADTRDFYWNAKNKENIIHQLSLEIEQAKLNIAPENKDLLKQLSQYEFEYKAGRYDYHGIDGHNDDLVAALAMALWASIKGYCKTGQGQSLAGIF